MMPIAPITDKKRASADGNVLRIAHFAASAGAPWWCIGHM
jgi:hypothetical protein